MNAPRNMRLARAGSLARRRRVRAISPEIRASEAPGTRDRHARPSGIGRPGRDARGDCNPMPPLLREGTAGILPA